MSSIESLVSPREYGIGSADAGLRVRGFYVFQPVVYPVPGVFEAARAVWPARVGWSVVRTQRFHLDHAIDLKYIAESQLC